MGLADPTTGSLPQPLIIWAVSDGRAGNAAPALGLAEAIATHRPARIIVKTIGWRGVLGRLPWFFNLFPRLSLVPGSAIEAPWPDIWIAAGRATLPLSMHLRRWSQARTLVVQLQDPRAPKSAFDLIIAPRHDQTQGANVFQITGSPHRVTAERLTTDAQRFAELIDPLPHPRLAVLIGGRSKAHDLSPARAQTMADDIRAATLQSGGSVMVTFSRRTPAPARDILSAGLGDLPGVIWDGTGDNPYFAFLAGADVILVTEDSINMATEAGATGKPVYILSMDGGRPKFARFHADLVRQGVARPFQGHLEAWQAVPLNETDRAAKAVLDRLGRISA